MAEDNPPPPPPPERLLGDYGARDRNRNRLTITNQPVTMQIFCNGLRLATRQVLDTASGGSINFKTATQIIKVIEAVALIDQMEMYDRTGGTRGELINLNQLEHRNAQNILTNKQIQEAVSAEVTKRMAAINLSQPLVAQVN
ncbi:hypothetical protein P8452_17905 [Trifolium repens]|nr:hypothetical protein P8452_17905 [Trifolium repens]